MSPFEEINDRIAGGIRALDLRAQILVLATGARVLLPRYEHWHRSVGRAENMASLVREAISAAEEFVLGKTDVQRVPALLDELELGAPSDPSDSVWFTAAQDCWTLADSALRVIAESFDAGDATWYLLEPIFQTTSERLFGFSDVGSDAQEAAEGQALSDPALAAAVRALESAIAELRSTASPNAADLARCARALQAIRP